MLSHKKLLVTLFLFICFISTPRDSFALGEIGVQDTDISIETIPENPEPYKEVSINLTSYSTDLNKAFIEWKNGSKVVLSGIGRTSYSFTALGPNTNTLFTVGITPSETGTQILKQVSIAPSDIEVFWEGVDSYTPPFYKGKSFVSQEGLIRVVAIPNTNRAQSTKTNMVYTWKNNGKTVQSASGYGKDSYIFANSELNNTEKVTVTASSVDGSYNATKTIRIPIVSPKIIFYKKSPTEGTLYNHALSNGEFVSEEEVTLVAVPYFIGLVGNESKFTYNWKINNKDIDTPSKKTELTIRPSTRGGYADINLTMENLSTFFQKVSGNLKITL